MERYELILDEEQDIDGVQAISLVSDPAIESNFIALNKDKIQLAAVNDEKRILMGAALIPNKSIYRRDGNLEYEVFFTDETVRKASELFFKNANQSKTTLEHVIDLKGNTIVESWIKEDNVHDKSARYAIDVPIGSWVVSMKIEDDATYKMAKDGLIRGFSIEGYFIDKMVQANKQEEIENEDDKLADEIMDLIKNVTNK